jgi:glycine/D-amino acid oxidase-like deaminating enzyme
MWQRKAMMSQLVHPDALHFDHPVASYWEESATPLGFEPAALNAHVQCDVAIVGAGFTGLSAAIELAGSNLDVCVLDAGPIGWGASGRNGGFACIGSHKLSYGKMIRTYGLDATRDFYHAMRASIDLVAETITRFGIDAWRHGEGEVTLAHLPGRMEDFRAEQEFLESVFGDRTELLSREQLHDQGLHGPLFHGGLRGMNGFGLHPLNYVRGLARAATAAGARLHARTRVIRWEQQGGKHHLYTDQGKIAANRVLVATNGYTPENVSHHHQGRILPALSSIIVTRPLTADEQRNQGWWSSTMAYDSRHLLHYFRILPNGRFLFGGRGGTDSSDAAGLAYRDNMIATFHRLFPAWRDVDISHYWRGHVCLAYDRVPYVGPLDETKSVWTALAYHGNGVAMGSWCGRAVAGMMIGKRHDVPAVIIRRLARFPLPMFRPLYLKGAYMWYGWKDAI